MTDNLTYYEEDPYPHLDFREAIEDDLPELVAMLADDPLGAKRETPDFLVPYEQALMAISADPNLKQLVCKRDGEIVGTMQISLIPGLSRQGMMRMQIEGLRVKSSARGEGIGGALMWWAKEFAEGYDCGLIELTTDKSRVDAHRFYEGLGFEQSHYGYKLKLV